MQLNIIRLVLNPIANLFKLEADREQWLRFAFSEPFTFAHRRKSYHFVPERLGPADPDAVFIMGRVGRPTVIRENEPPESGLEEITRPSWTAARFFLDPRRHEDGQKVAFESTDVGDPLNVLRSMLTHINKRYEAPFRIEANAVIPDDSFLSFIKAHPRDITFIQFELNAPNMFDDKTNVDVEMRAARDKYKARKAKITLANEEGMTLNDERILQLADYATKGGGQIKAKTLNHDSFNSHTNIETVKVDPPDDASDKTLLSIIASMIFRR
jgi:hypothetical protein